MMNKKILRPLIFVITALLHLALLLFTTVNIENSNRNESQNAGVMKLTDIIEQHISMPEEEISDSIERIPEEFIQADIPMIQSEHLPYSLRASDNYLPMHMLSSPPKFNENAIALSLNYPQPALRSGIEGRVFLELLVDHNGNVQGISILREEPEGWGFGESALGAFAGLRGEPALLNGKPVSSRFRYPVSFRIK